MAFSSQLLNPWKQLTYAPCFCFLLMVLFSLPHNSAAISDPVEVVALRAIKRELIDPFNRLGNWVGNDPCGDAAWTGVICDINGTQHDGTQHVIELRLLNMNFTGTLAPDLGNLTQLGILNVMWNNITGSIPPEIGLLSHLTLLLLNGNKLSGVLPPELGYLSELNRIQIDQNNISGPIPTTFQYLEEVWHLHMNNNSLNGSIPRELGRLPSLVHLLLDNNALTGEIPSEISNISTLLIVQLDNNKFSGSIPASFSNFSSNFTKLSLRNCNLTGSIPSLENLTSLGYLDLSHNKLTGQLPALPDQSNTITTIDLSYNQLSGEIPESYYKLPSLDFLILRDNSLDGNFSGNQISHNAFQRIDSVLIIDIINNNITGFSEGALVSNITIRLYGNPVCDDPSAKSHCNKFNGTDANDTLPTPNITWLHSCTSETCATANNQELVYGLYVLGTCQCAFPLRVGYRLKSPGFAIFSPYAERFRNYLSSGLNLSDYQVNVSSYSWQTGPRLAMDIKLFPTNNTSQFTQSEVEHLYSTFVTWNMPDNNTFGPYEVVSFVIGYPYNISLLAPSSTGLNGGKIAGIVIGAVVFTAIVVFVLMLLFSKRMRRYAGPLAVRRRNEHIKIAGVKYFTFQEVANATKNFDSSMLIGQGGYGKVYKGVLPDGVEVAIKRAQEGSLQGANEFYTEIELLSRVHHRSLVSLLGYCDDAGEQMLVYEFMPNGTLREHLNSGLRCPLDFATRMQIALGSARGILYLHTEANPPIFHRDIKATNILLDAKWRAKVADFGLSKLAPISDIEGDAGGHVSTVVKGTPGYLDPEYFLTRKLTDKSDVYSFGVVLLELITGMQSISQGKNLVREVNVAHESGMVLLIVDKRMGSYPAECVKPLIDLALSCCKDNTDSRPSISEVVRALEAIWRMTPRPDYMVGSEDTLTPDNHQNALYSGDSNHYVSSDIDGSGLMSGAILRVAAR